jgi:hypothetical protein
MGTGAPAKNQLRNWLIKLHHALAPTCLVTVVCAVVIMNFSILTPSYAQDALSTPKATLSMLPAMQSINIVPGQTSDYMVKISNDGDSPFNIQMLALPYAVNDDYSGGTFDDTAPYSQVAEWVAFAAEDESFRLEVGGNREIRFQINTPENAQAGGQYAAIVAKATLDNQDSALNVVYQVVSLIFAEVDGDKTRSGEIISREYQNWYMDGNIQTNLTIKNTGNTSLSVNNRLLIHSLLGRELASVDLGDSLIVRDDERTFNLNWESAWPMGLYYITQESVFLGETVSYQKLVLILPVWAIILLVAVIVAGAALIVKSTMNKRRLA